MTRVIRSEADLSRILARRGYRVAEQFGGEVVNTDQRAGRMPCRPAPTDPGVQTVQPSPPSTSGMAVATAGLTRTAACDGASAAIQTSAKGVRLDHAMRTTPGGASRCVGKFQPAPAGLAPGPLTLPWPPTGNSAVRHAQGVHYLRPEVIAYRDSVAALCAKRAPVRGRYRLHVHMSPPDARARDIDNALKSLLDALVKAGYMQSDSMTYMRELLVTVDDDRLNHVRVLAIPYDLEAA